MFKWSGPIPKEKCRNFSAVFCGSWIMSHVQQLNLWPWNKWCQANPKVRSGLQTPLLHAPLTSPCWIQCTQHPPHPVRLHVAHVLDWQETLYITQVLDWLEWAWYVVRVSGQALHAVLTQLVRDLCCMWHSFWPLRIYSYPLAVEDRTESSGFK